MKTVLPTLIFLCIFSQLLKAQDFIQFSTGNGYVNQAYYSLAEQNSVNVANDEWDLIFTTFGQQDAGIHVNESTSSIFGVPAPTIELYLTNANSLAAVNEFDSLFTRVYNDETSWAYGALNNTRNPNNILDFGWGFYNPAVRSVVGNKVFVIKLRSGDFKKFTVDSLVFTTYHMTFANLDGSEETQVSFDKLNYPNGLAYFSFTTGNTVDIGVPQFDLLFTRYVTDLYDPDTGDTLDYPVTGVLSAPGVQVAKIVNMDTKDIGVDDVPDSFGSRMDEIGYDWKEFDFVSSWLIQDSTAYIVKTPNGKMYKLVFIDFEGSSTGTATFEQTELGLVSNVRNLNTDFNTFNVFPNPGIDQFNISFEAKESLANVELHLFNTLGQRVWTQPAIGVAAGLNAIQIELPGLNNGQYTLVLQSSNSIVTRRVVIQR